MATVRFSKELTDAIIKNAGHMFDKQMDAARNNINATWGDRIYEIIHAKYIPAMGALPMHFFSTTWEMKVSKINGKDIGGLVCKLTAERPVPNSLPKDVPAKGKDWLRLRVGRSRVGRNCTGNCRLPSLYRSSSRQEESLY
jgi:hypothetical protein